MKSKEAIASSIRTELRSIFRLRDELRSPLERFEALRPLPDSGPRFYVVFDLRHRRRINGLKLGGIRRLSLPDERIQGQVMELAKAVWHLKDRLHQWIKVAGLSENVEDYASTHQELLVCADLANLKKHGRNKNRSGLNPHLGNVDFDTSKSGQIEFFYDGAAKDKEVLVEHPTPIPFTVQLLVDDGSASMGDAIAIVIRGFEAWLPLIQKLGVLDGDGNEERHLRSMLFGHSDG